MEQWKDQRDKKKERKIKERDGTMEQWEDQRDEKNRKIKRNERIKGWNNGTMGGSKGTKE